MTQPVYMIATIDVKDYDAYLQHYGLPVADIFAKAGAEVLVASPEVEVFEGEWRGNWTVVVKLPSMDVANELYNSEEYAPLKKLRLQELSNHSTLVIAPGIGG